jgi:hypothetical protein
MNIIVYGLERPENGRSCDDHDVCGEEMVVGDMVSLERSKLILKDCAPLAGTL